MARKCKCGGSCKSCKAPKGLYTNKTGAITKPLNSITTRSVGSRVKIPRLQPSNVGNQGDSAPVGRLKKGLF